MTPIDPDTLMWRITAAYADAAELIALFTVDEPDPARQAVQDQAVQDQAVHDVAARLGQQVNPGPIFAWLAATAAQLLLELAEQTGIPPADYLDNIREDALDAVDRAADHLRNSNGGG